MELRGESLVDTCIPGDVVIVVGVVKAAQVHPPSYPSHPYYPYYPYILL